jgi:hypothetical protein
VLPLLRKVADILESMGSRREYHDGYHRSAALELWASAVGPTLSQMSFPSGFDDDTLLVTAGHPAVAMEIRSRSSEILGKLNGLAGRALFTRIRVSVSPSSPERHDKV